MTTNCVIENDWSADERRAYERYSVDFFWRVYDQDTEALAGDVVDICLGGFQLLSEAAIPSRKKFRFRMDISLESRRREQIDVEARSVWQSQDINPGMFSAGFEFLNMPSETTQRIQSIIDEITTSV
jgi:c-di-GMP-binding flagellar brake protein YcgR